MTVFSHYPILLTNLKPATSFLLMLIAYCLTGLAFRQEMLIFMVGLYFLMPFMPYAMAFISQNTGVNLFETLPTDIVYFLSIDVFNLTQTANKLFLFTASGCFSIILFLILSSFFIRNFLRLIFTAIVKVFQFVVSVYTNWEK